MMVRGPFFFSNNINKRYEMIEWTKINWKDVEQKVYKLQCKIADATQRNEFAQISTYQRILVSSINARLLAVRIVTTNPGRKTAGMDGKFLITDEEKVNAAIELGRKPSEYKAQPVKRVYIPKNSGKQRPLGIPTITDRAMQALYNLALSPVMEIKGDSNSFGFRKGRSTHDAIQCLYDKVKTNLGPKYIYEADIKGFFDNISHSWIMNNVPLNSHVLKEFLDAGFLDKEIFNETVLGVPQGGIISPTIANMVQDGLENNVIMALEKAKIVTIDSVIVVRYADDFVITAKHEWIINKVIIPTVEGFLEERGLTLNREKSKTTHLTPQTGEVIFLGFSIHYGPWRNSNAIFLRPDVNKVEAFKSKIREVFTSADNSNSFNLVEKLNPILRGWSSYYRIANCGKLFQLLSDYVWNSQLAWAKKKYPGKGRREIVDLFFKKINGSLHFLGKTKDGFTNKTYRMDKTKIVYHKVRRPEQYKNKRL